ncbi:GmrSD restriction endonuclease domain-containing protein [Salinimicrobium sp. GXAS 041]|uniref:GmrSD restriction endonuclease domain-containing protein n=1 Tax=Salinimicrobium sp. GXAS 041 TaxID=3400806 RepID=UPI003C750CDE
MIQETFDSSKSPLNDILKSINDGKIQLPDFQRGWVWDDERVKGLIASIGVSYPIGAIMLLETGNPDVRFKPRAIHGADSNGYPESFILDGQQRLTTLFQTLYSSLVVDTKDHKQKAIKRWYYFDIKQALNPNGDMFDAILSIPEEKKITRNFGRDIILDLSTAEKEYENLMFPVNQVLNSTEWLNGYMEYWNYDKERIKTFQNFQGNVIKRFESYQLPVIKMLKHNPKDAVCQVFEKVNTGGVSLTVFELLTATFAADEFNLREDWEKRQKIFQQHDVICNLSSNELLQAITLFASINRKEEAAKRGVTPENLPAVTCKKKDVLKLDLETYKKWVSIATQAFVEAGKMLKKNKIFKSRDLPYSTQLVPLSVIIGRLENELSNDGVKQKIMRWYWNGILGELYGGANETRFAKDAVEVVDWIKGGEEPTTIKDAYFAEDRLWTLRTRNSAAYKGIFVLQMQNGAKDFKSGDEVEWTNYYDEAIDVHHIFPQKWCEENGIKPATYNSILNKTPLTARTNRMIGGRAPSVYLATVKKQGQIDDKRLQEILRSHFVNKQLLEKDSFDDFLNDRKESIIYAVEKATGKTVQRNQVTESNE